MSQGFYMLQSSHWHGPCTSDDTLPFGWLKKEAAAAASGFSPLWGSQKQFGSITSNVNPGLINPQAVELGGIPFMYQILTIGGVPPQLINHGLLVGGFNTSTINHH